MYFKFINLFCLALLRPTTIEFARKYNGDLFFLDVAHIFNYDNCRELSSDFIHTKAKGRKSEKDYKEKDAGIWELNNPFPSDEIDES